MRIAYVILTCKKFWDTRVPWQQETSLSAVPLDDIYYIGHMKDEDKHLFHWGAQDGYRELPQKMRDVFLNLTFDGYDWIFIGDDDTYVYTKRLENFLSNFLGSSHMVIGRKLDHIKKKWFEYYSGGAGTVLSHRLYTEMRNQVKHCDNPLIHWCADICVGKWLIDTKETCRKEGDIVIEVDHPGFHTDYYDAAKDNMARAITFHHLQTKEQWYALQKE